MGGAALKVITLSRVHSLLRCGKKIFIYTDLESLWGSPLHGSSVPSLPPSVVGCPLLSIRANSCLPRTPLLSSNLTRPGMYNLRTAARAVRISPLVVGQCLLRSSGYLARSQRDSLRSPRVLPRSLSLPGRWSRHPDTVCSINYCF